jgi:YHS domain-containing protein
MLLAGVIQVPLVINFGPDPVALVRDKKVVDGKSDLTVERNGFGYMFASAENRKKFLENPERYEIQLGGACGRMGPLSGIGNPHYFTVYKDRIYIFASPQCKAAFEKVPEKMLETDDAGPVGSIREAQAGVRLVKKLLEAHGGANAFRALKPLEFFQEGPVISGGKTYRVGTRTTFAFPNSYASEEWWDASSWGNVLGPKSAFFTSKNKFDRPMYVQQRQSAVRNRNHSLVYALYRAASGKAEFTSSESRPNDVAILLDGTRTTVTLDPKTGQAASITYRDRGPYSMLGEMKLTFTHWTRVQGALLPDSWTCEFDGKRVPDNDRTNVQIRPASNLAVFDLDRKP